MRLHFLLLLLAVFHGASARGARVQEQREFTEALLRGVRLSNSGDPHGALDAFEAAAALLPGDAAALQNVGVMAMQLGDATRAASAFKAALEASPTNAGLLSGLGQVRCHNQPGACRPADSKPDSRHRRCCS
jgi:cytochrome c-type biogenesis protein CcmH/NrfG